jgi:hypothetical protein
MLPPANTMMATKADDRYFAVEAPEKIPARTAKR